MRSLFILILLVLASFSLWAQQDITWTTLEKVEYAYIENSDQNFWYGEPTFSQEVKDLEGQKVTITGYVLPMDISGDNYVLSAFPFSSCFFCGGAGQESVMELRLADPDDEFKQDEYLTFMGVLKLNHRELELNYILEEAQVVEK